MSTHPISSARQIPAEDHSPLVRRAWISVALIPVAFVVAMLVGEGLMDILGYPGGEPDVMPPMGVALAVGVPLTLLGMLPGGFAAYFGLRARRSGDARGMVPAAIGASMALYMLFSNVLGIVGRLVG